MRFFIFFFLAGRLDTALPLDASHTQIGLQHEFASYSQNPEDFHFEGMPLGGEAGLQDEGLSLWAVVAMVTAWVWIVRPERIHALDRWARQHYVERVEESYAAADALLEAGQTEAGIAALEEHLESLTGVRKMDRLEPQVRQACRRLIEALSAAGRHDEAVPVYDRLIALDDRDLEALVGRASLVLELGDPALRDQAWQTIEEVDARVPGSPLVAPLAFRLAVERRDLVAALRLVRHDYRQQLARATLEDARWRFFWSTGERFAAPRSWHDRPQLEQGLRLAFRHDLEPDPGKLQRLRIDFPYGWTVRLEQLSVLLEGPLVSGAAEPLRVDLATAGTKTPNGWRTTPAGLVTDPDKRSTVIFKLPRHLDLSSGLSLSIHIEPAPVMPEALAVLFADRELVDSAIASLTHAGDLEGAELARRFGAAGAAGGS